MSIGFFAFYLLERRKFTAMIGQYEPLVKQFMTMQSKVGVDARKVKEGEKLTGEAILGTLKTNFPEVFLVLEMVKPELIEWIEENPFAAITLVQRYGKTIGRLVGSIPGVSQGSQEQRFDV